MALETFSEFEAKTSSAEAPALPVLVSQTQLVSSSFRGALRLTLVTLGRKVCCSETSLVSQRRVGPLLIQLLDHRRMARVCSVVYRCPGFLLACKVNISFKIAKLTYGITAAMVGGQAQSRLSKIVQLIHIYPARRIASRERNLMAVSQKQRYLIFVTQL